jgi:hypothetical protein
MQGVKRGETVKQELRKPERCPVCGMIKYKGETKYYCDGCGKELDADRVKEMETTGFPPYGREEGIVDFHFCNWQCLKHFWKQKTELLKAFDFIALPSPRPDTVEEVFK